MSLSVWGPFSNACKCFAYYNCYKALNIIIHLITLFILSLEYCPLPISAMVQGNIILAWQWSGTSIHIYMMAQDITPQHPQWSGGTSFQHGNSPGHPFTFTDVPGYHSSTFTMVRGNIILAWQWSGTSIHIYRCPGISQLNIHNGPGQHHSSMAMVQDIHNGPGQHHTSMAMVRDIHSHLWMARDITAQHSQWSGATSF